MAYSQSQLSEQFLRSFAASSNIPVKDLVVHRIGHNRVTVLGPVEMSNKAGVTHTVAKVAGLGTTTGTENSLGQMQQVFCRVNWREAKSLGIELIMSLLLEI